MSELYLHKRLLTIASDYAEYLTLKEQVDAWLAGKKLLDCCHYKTRQIVEEIIKMHEVGQARLANQAKLEKEI